LIIFSSLSCDKGSYFLRGPDKGKQLGEIGDRSDIVLKGQCHENVVERKPWNGRVGCEPFFLPKK
jgi:hypothetical protein